MIILVVTTKGGAGKSTTSQQLAATYFLQKKEPVKLLEIDDENLDSAYLTDSKIKSERLPMGSSSTANHVIEQLMQMEEKNIVIDVGGNRTATNFIHAAGETDFFSMVDLVIVPISNPGQDEENALQTINAIKQANTETKIILAVTRQMAQSQAEFDDVFNRYFRANELLSATDEVVFFPQVMAMVHSRALAVTLYEMAHSKDTLLPALSEQMVSAKKSGDNQAAIRYSRIRASVVQSQSVLPFIQACHDKFDKVLTS